MKCRSTCAPAGSTTKEPAHWVWNMVQNQTEMQCTFHRDMTKQYVLGFRGGTCLKKCVPKKIRKTFKPNWALHHLSDYQLSPPSSLPLLEENPPIKCLTSWHQIKKNACAIAFVLLTCAQVLLTRMSCLTRSLRWLTHTTVLLTRGSLLNMSTRV